METIIFTNAKSTAIEFSETSQYKLIEKSGFGAGDIAPDMDEIYNINGAVYRRSSLGVRYIKVKFSVVKSSEAEFDTVSRTIITTLNPLLGEGLITYTNTTGTYRIDAVVVSGPTIVARGVNACVLEVVFLCAQPLFESNTEYSVSGTGSVSPNYFLLTVDNTGDWETPIKALAINASVKIYPSSVVGNTFLSFSSTAFSSTRVDTDMRHPSIIRITDGIEYDASGNLAQDSTFIQIPPGLITVRVQSSGIPTVTLYWRKRYVGVSL